MPRRQRDKPYVPREITDADFRSGDEPEDGGEQPGGADAEQTHPPAWTKAELIDAAGISPKSFDTIRKAARVKGPSHGGLKHVFSAMDLIALIQKVSSGTFSLTGKPIAEAWTTLLHEAGMRMPETISRRRRE
jgi:hypothetical protein